MGDHHRITSLEQLRALHREPSSRVRAKKTDVLGPTTRADLGGCRFVLLATSAADGSCDVSPRGGPPGLLQILDESTVALPDLGGNNLLDSMTNIVANPHAGLLTLRPGRDETIRIDGPAHLSVDPSILSRWDDILRRPKVAVVVEVASVFIHCAKAFRRSELWNPESWDDEIPEAAALLDEHLGGGLDVPAIRDGLEASYRSDLADEAR